MTDDAEKAFFTLHRDLPREGPGEAADVAWAADLAGLRPDARICDAACGPGADIAALLRAAPQGQVTALDKVAHFADAAVARHRHDPRVTVQTANMETLTGTFDMIWCAGAVYFLGVQRALELWRPRLAPGGVIAFSEICWFTDTPSPRAATLWAEYPAMTDADGIGAHIAAAGYETLGNRRLSDAAWDAYFTPIDQRSAVLRPGASTALLRILDEAAEEARCWRAHRDEFGYLLSVVRPA